MAKINIPKITATSEEIKNDPEMLKSLLAAIVSNFNL